MQAKNEEPSPCTSDIAEAGEGMGEMTRPREDFRRAIGDRLLVNEGLEQISWLQRREIGSP
jgi:hypothetical protein